MAKLHCTQKNSNFGAKDSNNFQSTKIILEMKYLNFFVKIGVLPQCLVYQYFILLSYFSELPDTSFTRSISNPEAVMRRRRQQKLEKKLQQFRSRDGGPDTGGTLKIYGESLRKDVPYKTLLVSVSDPAVIVVEEMLDKYALDRKEAPNFCLVQITTPPGGEVNGSGHHEREYYLEDDECPLAILMNHPPSRGKNLAYFTNFCPIKSDW